jgi:hypothetical protein
MTTFNLSAYAQALMSGGMTAPRSLELALSGATLTVYSGRQPATADTALRAENVALIAYTFPVIAKSVVGMNRLITLENLPDVLSLAAGYPSFARVTNGGNTIFDCSVGIAGTLPDIIIKYDWISKGQTVRITSGNQIGLTVPPQCKAGLNA